MRFVIGIAALVAIAAARVYDEQGSMELLEVEIADKIELVVRQQNASLPKQLDGITILEAVDIDKNSKAIIYRYTLTSSDLDKQRVQNWVEKEMKPDAAKGVCEDPAVTVYDWKVRYRYYDTSSRIVAETTVTRFDC